MQHKVSHTNKSEGGGIRLDGGKIRFVHVAPHNNNYINWPIAGVVILRYWGSGERDPPTDRPKLDHPPPLVKIGIEKRMLLNRNPTKGAVKRPLDAQFKFKCGGFIVHTS